MKTELLALLKTQGKEVAKMKAKNGKVGRLAKLLWNLRNSTHDFTRAKKWADGLTVAIKIDPGILFELRLEAGEIERRLKEIALRRGRQLYGSLLSQRNVPGCYLRADAREIEKMIEEGFLSYADLDTTPGKIRRLARQEKD